MSERLFRQGDQVIVRWMDQKVRAVIAGIPYAKGMRHFYFVAIPGVIGHPAYAESEIAWADALREENE